MGGAFTITVASGAQQEPAVAWDDGREGYLVVWSHANGSDADVRGRVVGAEGTLLGSEITITAAAAAEEQYPAVAANGAGGYVVAWQEGATSSDIAAAVVDGSGQVLGSGVETLAEEGNTQERPALSYDSARGRYLAVWMDYRNSAEEPDVYGQLYRDYTVAIDYSYDPLGRLVEADYRTGVRFGYAYDETDNRTMLTETTPLSGTIVTTYTYDDADRLLTVTRAGVATAYIWNDRGDLLDDGQQEYAWDAAGRLTGVSVTDGLAVEYLYDGSNNRTAMIVAGVTTTYVVDPYGLVDHVSQVLIETTAGESTRNFYGLDLLAQAGSTTTIYLGYDALSVRLRLDEDGSLVDAYRYGPFGEAMGAGPSGYGFAGERWDEPVGLVYLRARYYAPEVGRFVSRDPLAGRPDQPDTLNRFVYVTNRPAVLVDPSGLSPNPRACPPIEELLRQGQLELDDATPVWMKAAWPWVKLIDAHEKIPCGCYKPLDLAWTQEDKDLAADIMETIEGVFVRVGCPRLMNRIPHSINEWTVYRSQPFFHFKKEGGRGGRTDFGSPPPEIWTFFYGPTPGQNYYDAKDRGIHEFGHMWDVAFERVFGTYIHQYAELDSPEAWALGFVRAIRGEEFRPGGAEALRTIIKADRLYGPPPPLPGGR